MTLNDHDFNESLEVMQKLLWGSLEDRSKLQDFGLNLIPANFYSNIPSISETLDSFEYSQVFPYLDSKFFDQNLLREEISSLQLFGNTWAPDEFGDPETCTSYFARNGQFENTDAIAYYAFLKKLKPKTVVEIGSGFSSLIALQALRENGFGQLICIDPFPRPFIKQLAESGNLDLLQKRVQDVTISTIDALLEDGDFLFIDSTHTVKTGSDCLHIYLRLIPQITSNIIVHAHDIFLPDGMPQRWIIDLQIYWTEQYLLLALLIDNPRTTVLFPTHYNTLANSDLLAKCLPASPTGVLRGGSFWFSYNGGQNSANSHLASNIQIA
jgi:predicted O-methyltransferase YrrM